MGKIDLHIHTTASDGRFSPSEIVQQAQSNGMEIIAITDHDALEGIWEALQAAEAYPWLTIIPGVEINTDVPNGEVHILGYFIDYLNKELQDVLRKLRSSRVERAKKMVDKLKRLNVNIDMERVQQIAGNGTIGRPHIAEAILEKKYISNFKEAFTRYIGRGGPAYVEREKITPVEAVKLVIRAGGLPVFGHPLTCENPEAMSSELKPAGLAGMEVYYNGYTEKDINTLLKIAKKYDLIPTGGSDYHGIDANSETMMGNVTVPAEDVQRFILAARNSKR